MPKGRNSYHGFFTIEYQCKCGLKKACKSDRECDNYIRLHSKYCKKANILDHVETVTVKGMVKEQHILGQGKVV